MKHSLEISTANRKLESGQRALAYGLLSQIRNISIHMFDILCLRKYLGC